MIVRSTPEGWRIVFQSAHGLLAQCLAAELQVSDQLPFWQLTQTAIGIHDDGKQPYRRGARTYLTDAGAPRDFVLVPMASDDRRKDAESHIWEARKKHRWIGLLVSFHTDVLYREESVSAEMSQFLEKEEIRRAAVLDELNATTDDLQNAYDWMHWCDRLSLILAGEDVPAMQRHVEIITNSLGQRYDLHQAKDGSLQVDPWPFRRQQFTVAIEGRTITQLAFRDDEELSDALCHAKVTERTHKFETKSLMPAPA